MKKITGHLMKLVEVFVTQQFLEASRPQGHFFRRKQKKNVLNKLTLGNSACTKLQVSAFKNENDSTYVKF